jgi:hypothetical protein
MNTNPIGWRRMGARNRTGNHEGRPLTLNAEHTRWQTEEEDPPPSDFGAASENEEEDLPWLGATA